VKCLGVRGQVLGLDENVDAINEGTQAGAWPWASKEFSTRNSVEKSVKDVFVTTILTWNHKTEWKILRSPLKLVPVLGTGFTRTETEEDRLETRERSDLSTVAGGRVCRRWQEKQYIHFVQARSRARERSILGLS